MGGGGGERGEGGWWVACIACEYCRKVGGEREREVVCV